MKGNEEQKKVFFKNLDLLNPGQRSALRRASGTMIEEVPHQTRMIFYRCLPDGIPQWQESRWFAIACLRCLWDAEPEDKEKKSGKQEAKPLVDIIRGLLKEEAISDSAMHRVSSLLEESWDTDGYMLMKLKGLIQLVRQKSPEMPDFSKLLDDLIGWNSDKQYVQFNWSRAITLD